MNKLETENYTTYLWNTKHISEPDEEWFIYKIFKTRRQILPIDEQRKIIEKKMKYFWEYIPETILIEITDKDYIIKQKFIEWKTLSQTNIWDLPIETLEWLIDLIKKYLKYHNEQWWEMDITWYQFYEWNPSSIVRKIKNFLKIYKNFLTSTNIMIWENWNVYMVDVCESADSRIQWKIKNFCAKPFIKMTISKLEHILEWKINFESENTNEELFSTLSE